MGDRVTLAVGGVVDMREKDETPEDRAERKFHEQAKLKHGDRLVMHYLEGIRRAILAQTKDYGKWQYFQLQVLGEGLAAIALAASTPTDNSEEVKALTARTKAVADTLEGVSGAEEA